MLNRQGRPSSVGEAGSAVHPTFTGNKALAQIEPLIFEIGHHETTGVDLDEPEAFTPRLGGLERKDAIGLPGLSEPEAMRHYVRLSQMNYGIDTGLFPLGLVHDEAQCAPQRDAWRGCRAFADVHPLQPVSTVQRRARGHGRAVALSGHAHQHHDGCAIAESRRPWRALRHDGHQGRHRGERRGPRPATWCWCRTSAHGTNPATAALIGFTVRPVPARDDGWVHVDDVKKLIGPDVAAIMLTNPNTCGLFENQVIEIAKAIHDAGAYFYCDGANFNAIVGKARPGDLGIDAMHINLHKTFSTPHGGGGPGSGPVVLSARLAPFAPVPFVTAKDGVLTLVEEAKDAAEEPFGRITAFHGQMGMYVRALTYMLSHGSDGMKQASEDAVLNANYIRASLSDLFSQPFGDKPCMHEVLFDDTWLKDTGVTTLDFAKAMIDEGYHPMTMYFPLVVHGAMLIEPTESESKASLDLFIAALRDLAMSAKGGETGRFSGAPYHAPRRRLDETRAARSPVLKWTKPAPLAEAAE